MTSGGMTKFRFDSTVGTLMQSPLNKRRQVFLDEDETKRELRAYG